MYYITLIGKNCTCTWAQLFWMGSSVSARWIRPDVSFQLKYSSVYLDLWTKDMQKWTRPSKTPSLTDTKLLEAWTNTLAHRNDLHLQKNLLTANKVNWKNKNLWYKIIHTFILLLVIYLMIKLSEDITALLIKGVISFSWSLSAFCIWKSNHHNSNTLWCCNLHFQGYRSIFDFIQFHKTEASGAHTKLFGLVVFQFKKYCRS